MTTKEAITLFKYYLQSNHKRRTIERHTMLLNRFNAIHAERLLDDISPDEIFHFLEDLTRVLAKSTKRLRYAQLKAFYNFIIDRCSLNMRNPCNVSLLSKSFKAPKQVPHKILERETVDEMIYNTRRKRDRLILELQARCGLRIVAPHDLRRYSATYASRNGVPLEVVSKVILRHQDLKTTQVHLGKISDSEAIRWMDVLHGK
jgi:integrase